MPSRTKGAPAPGFKGASPRVRGLRVADTNLNSYDRTDPWTAINVLRKLISTLPSRIGGCQYKLSPEEHKLSMHLLTIVEPFVGLSPSRRTLTRQPTEILDAIVLRIDSKRDLLALGLTCHRLHDIVFPRHFDYRVIRCKVSSIRVWNHLSTHRSLARNVRRLEILDERTASPELVPRGILTSDTDLESTDDELTMHAKQGRFLVSALVQMTALQTFVWACNHSPLSIDDVWPILLKCSSLNEVQMCDNLVFNSLPEGEKETQKNLCLLPELRTATFRSTNQAYGATKNPELSRVSGMLNHCPLLESLTINYEQRRGTGFHLPLGDNLLMYSRWPQLRSLTLSNLRCSSIHGFDAAATFLFAHANLEILHLDINFSSVIGGAGGGAKPQLKLLPNSLPHLQELKCSKDLMNLILLCPCDEQRPLETIKGVRLTGSAGDQAFLANLKKYASNVKKLEMVGWNEMDDVKRLVDCIPNLTWLDLGKRVISGANPGPSGGRPNKSVQSINTNVSEWAALLSNLPELTTFHGARFFYEVSSDHNHNSSTPLGVSDRSRVRKNDEIASVLAWKCPKLRRVDHWDDNSGKVIILARDGEKVRYEARRVRLGGATGGL